LNGLPKKSVSRQMIERERARRHLVDFMMLDSRGQWQPAKHLTLLCNALEAVERGEVKRLMVFMPPRHGKSEVVSKKFPAWYLGRNPDREIILCSYAADLAYDFSRIVRNTLRDHEQIFSVKLAGDAQAVGRWRLEGRRGGLTAAGVGGSICGFGGNMLIVDDPFKNSQEAESATIRNSTWEWYRSTLRTRLAPSGAIVLVQTRWHEDDLAGQLLREAQGGGEQWQVLCMPAFAEDTGEYLWPERFTANEYDSLKTTLGSRLWASLYQQQPRPEEGGIFKRQWWKYYTVVPERFDTIIISWDCAFKGDDHSDYVVGQVWGKKGPDKYLLDQVRGKFDFPTTLMAIRSLCSKWPRAQAKLIEDKANGPAVIAMLKKEIPGLIAVTPEGGKIVRAQAVCADIEAGNVYLPDPIICKWAEDFVEECTSFPNGAHDDMVDAMTQALTRLNLYLKTPILVVPIGIESESGWRRF